MNKTIYIPRTDLPKLAETEKIISVKTIEMDWVEVTIDPDARYLEIPKTIVHADGRVETIYILRERKGISEADVRGGTLNGRLGS